MSIRLVPLMIGAIACSGAAAPASGDTMGKHTILAPEQVKWGPGPASIPPGAQAVVLFGDPTKEEMFALRLRLPDGYHIPPHTHPKPEVVTVLSGVFLLGTGETADRSIAQSLPTSSFFALAPGMTHFAFAEGDTVIQLNSMGPWSLNYVNPKDDPRTKSQ